MWHYRIDSWMIMAGGKIVPCDGQGEVMKQRNTEEKGLKGYKTEGKMSCAGCVDRGNE